MTISRRDLNIPLSDTMHHVLRKLGDEGHKALVVGGAVRDAMLGEEPKDIDVEVYGTHYDHLSKTLSQHGKVNLVGKAFGVVKFTDPDGNDYDFSLPRRDNKTGVGHKDFSTDFDPDITPKEAASRRDFTFNSMAYDPEKGELHDYFHGEEDLKNKVIRHTSDAFSEDPLRVLRGMQFSARFGMHLHPDTAKECQRISDQYDSIPKERVGEEFMKLATKGKHPGAAIDYLKESGWSKNFPAIHALHGVPQDSGYHPEGDVATHTAHSMDAAAKIADREGLKGDDRATIVFGAMCHDMGKPSTTKEWPYGYREVEPPTRETEWEENGGWRRPTVTSHGHDEVGEPIARQFLSDINVKPDIADKVAPLVREHMQHVNFTTGVSSRTVRRLAQRVAPASIKELGHVMEADNSGRPPHAPNLPVGAKNMLDKAEESHVTEKPMEKFIQGRDVLPYFPDVKPGPHIGETVKAAYEAQLNGEINSPEEGQEWLKKRFNNKTAMAVHPGFLDKWIKENGPYMYHGVRSLPEVHGDTPVEDVVEKIKREGIRPNMRGDAGPPPDPKDYDWKGQDPTDPNADYPDDYDMDVDEWHLHTRPNHVYMIPDKDNTYGDHVFRIDLRKLDPKNINPDEDVLRDHGWKNPETGEHYMPRGPHRPRLYPDEEPKTLGQEAEDMGWGDDPRQTEFGFNRMGDHGVAHRGTIPPDAIKYMGPKRSKTSALRSSKEAPQCSICEGRTSIGEWGEEQSCRKCKGTGYAPHPFSTEGVYGTAEEQGMGFGDPRFDRDKDNVNMCGACGYDESHQYLHHPDHGFPKKVLLGDPRTAGDIRTQIDLDAYDHRKCLYCHKDGHHYTECPEKPWEGQNWWGDGVENPAQPIGWAQKTARKYRDFTSAPVAYQVKHIEQVHDANANGYVANDLGGWDIYHAMLHRDEDFRSVLGYGIGHNTADNPHEHAGTFPLGPTDPRFRAAPDSGLDKYYKKGQVAHPDVFPLDKCMFIRQLKDPYDPRGRRITCNKPPVAWVAFKGGRGPDKDFYDTPKSWGGLCKDHVDVFGGSGKLWERTTQRPKVVQQGDPRYHRLGSGERCYYYSDHQNDPRQENGGENPCIRPVAGYTTNQYGDRRPACRIHGQRIAEMGDKWEPFKTAGLARDINDPRGQACVNCGESIQNNSGGLWTHTDTHRVLCYMDGAMGAPMPPQQSGGGYRSAWPNTDERSMWEMERKRHGALVRDLNDPRGQECARCGAEITFNDKTGSWLHTGRPIRSIRDTWDSPCYPLKANSPLAKPKIVGDTTAKMASWADVRNKAVRMRNSGRVHIIQMSTDVVVADVDGDHATYRTELWRQFPGQKNITLWDCTCDWNTYAWGTTGPRRKFEGRMCSHALAVLYETLGKERKRSKTAHKLHYHVAPSAARESISQNGIDASKGNSIWGAGGNYLFKNKSDARTYINEALPRIQRSQDWDMWQVDTSGLKLEPDEEDEMAREFTDEGARHDYAHKELQGYQHITGDPIEPARLQLLDTLTSPKNQQEWEEAHDRGEHAPITHADFSVRRYQEAGPRLENCSRCKQQWFKGARNASIDSSSELDRCSQTIWRKVEYGDPRYDRSNVPMINGTPLLNAQESRDWVKRFNTPLPRPCGKPAVEWHSPGRDEWFAKCAEHATGRPIPDPDKQWLHTTEKPTPGKTAGMADPDLHPRDWNDPRGPVKDTCHNCGGEIHLKENPAGEPDWYHLRSDGHTLSLYCGVDMSQGLRLAEPKTAHRMRRPDDPRGPTTTECKNCGQPLHLSPHPRTGELDWYHKVSDPGVTEYYSMYCDQDLRRSVAEPKTAGRDPNDPRGEECGNCGEELKWHEPTGQWIHQGRDLNWAAAVCIIDGKQGEWSYGKPPVMVKPKHGMVFNPPKKYYKADWSELPDKVYHVAPRSARESIEREGLDSTGRTHNFVQDTMGWSGDYYQHGPKTPEWNKAYHYRPEAVYAIASPAAAAETVRAFNERRGEPHDAWEIDTDSLRAHQNQPEHKTDVIRDPELLQDSWESEKNEPKEYRSYDSPEEAWETFKESPIGPNQEEDDARSWAFEKVHREHIRRVPTYQMKDPDDWDEDDHEELREHNPALHKEYFGDEDEDWEKEGKMAAVSFGGDPRLDQWQDYTDDPYCKRGEPHNPTAVTRVRTIPVSTEKLHSFLGLDTPGLIRSRYNGKYRGDEWDKKIKDVSDNGILEPLTIAVNDSTDASHPHVSVIDGTHRIAWAHELGMPTVPCEVRYFGDGVHHDPFEKPIKTAGSGGKLVFSPRGSRPVTLDVEIAEDARSIKQGLMNRPSMPLNHGMVFLSPNPPARSGFWMMSTLIPLTLITWDRTGRVLEIIDMEPCRSGSNCPVYTPRTPYWGAVEVNQGYAASYRITPGDRVELRR